MENVQKVLQVRKGNVRRGIIITNKNVFEIDMFLPHNVTIWFDPANFDYQVQYCSEEVNPKSIDYTEIINKFIELRSMMYFK